MRGTLSYNMIPLPHDEIINVEPTNVITNISSNVYYGYQPRIHTHAKDSQDNRNSEQRLSDNNQMEIQFDNFHQNNMQIENDITRYVNRKRRLPETTNDDSGEFKKRRQSDFHFFTDDYTSDEQMHTSSTQKAVVHLRNPTHNIPDLPRCIMGHYV